MIQQSTTESPVCRFLQLWLKCCVPRTLRITFFINTTVIVHLIDWLLLVFKFYLINLISINIYIPQISLNEQIMWPSRIQAKVPVTIIATIQCYWSRNWIEGGNKFALSLPYTRISLITNGRFENAYYILPCRIHYHCLLTNLKAYSKITSLANSIKAHYIGHSCNQLLSHGKATSTRAKIKRT